MSSSVWFLTLSLSGGGLTVNARGLDLDKDLEIGVVGTVRERSLVRSSSIAREEQDCCTKLL